MVLAVVYLLSIIALQVLLYILDLSSVLYIVIPNIILMSPFNTYVVFLLRKAHNYAKEKFPQKYSDYLSEQVMGQVSILKFLQIPKGYYDIEIDGLVQRARFIFPLVIINVIAMVVELYFFFL
jgi:hypothetical protein